MSFISFNFWLVFPFLFFAYWLLPYRFDTLRKLYLIFVSYAIYATFQPVYTLLLAGITISTFLGGVFLERYPARRKILTIFVVVLTLMPLIVFKYFNFIHYNVVDALNKLGVEMQLTGLNWAIPIGISFFTFQAIGYYLDCYHNRIKAEKNAIDYTLFVCFFPQIASGPISKATELLPQIKRKDIFVFSKAKDGIRMIVWGLFLKLVIADRLGMCVDTIYKGFEIYSGFTCFIGSVFYSLQIYCDFAGYTYLALGIARMFGYDLINNFRQPYFSISITDFWRRWHISLSRWLKDYIYIPLGGSRCSRIRNYWNIFITFLVSGIWHGANWTFIIWGIFHGVVQILEKQFNMQAYQGNRMSIRCIRIIITFLLVNFAWIFFRMPSVDDAMNYIEHMITTGGSFNMESTGLTSLFVLTISLAILLLRDILAELRSPIQSYLNNTVVSVAVMTTLLAFILSVGVLDNSTFIYANF